LKRIIKNALGLLVHLDEKPFANKTLNLNKIKEMKKNINKITRK